MGAPRAKALGRIESVLLEIELPGRVFRYTSGSEPVLVTNGTGESFLYVSGFGRVLLERVAGEVASGVSVEVYAQPGASWARLAKQGFLFESIRATVRHHFEGLLLEEAEVFIEGRAVSPAWGDESEPLTFTVEAQLNASGSLPLPTQRIDDQTFAVLTIDPEVYGATYPIVIGTPGQVSGSVPAPTTPAYLVQFDGIAEATNRWLIAGHEVHATTVTLYDIDAGISAPLTVQLGLDALGQTYSYVDSSAWGGTTSLGNEHRVAWTGGGGVYNATRTGPLRGGGEVPIYILQTYAPAIRIDFGRAEAQRATLDAYKFDFAVTQPTEAWALIAGNILPMLPADLVETSGGRYFQYRRLDAPKTAAVRYLDSTPNTGNVQRTSRVTGGGTNIANRITLRYAMGGEDQRFLRSVTIDATKKPGDTNAIASYRCEQSQLALETSGKPGSGVRQLDLTSKVIYEDATAFQVVRDKALDLAIPPRLLTVVGGTEFDDVEINGSAALTAGDLFYTEERAIFRRKGLVEGGIELTLLLVDAPFGVLRLTS